MMGGIIPAMASSAPLVVLTDFGTADPYVGILKGVIARIAPRTPTIDLTHEIPPGDIPRGAFVLWQARPSFPAGTVFLAVVDPGVGTARRPILVQAGGHTFVGPDNGLFTFVCPPGSPAWALENPAYQLAGASRTFHGRDIFAPGAAHAARGVAGNEFGPALPEIQRLPLPRLEAASPSILHGETLHADRFGNIFTSLGQFTIEPGALRLYPWVGTLREMVLHPERVHLHLPGGPALPLVVTFAEIPEGACAALVGSTGLLEIAANRASAAEILGLPPGAPVSLIHV